MMLRRTIHVLMLVTLSGCSRAAMTYHEPGVKDLPQEQRARICGPMHSRLTAYDGRRVAGNYQNWEVWVTPGTHSVTIQYFRSAGGSGSRITVFSEDSKSLSIDAEPGRTYEVSASSDRATRMINRFLLAYGDGQRSRQVPISDWQARVVDQTGQGRLCEPRGPYAERNE